MQIKLKTRTEKAQSGIEEKNAIDLTDTEDHSYTLLLFLKKRINKMEEKEKTKMEHRFPKIKESLEFEAQTNQFSVPGKLDKTPFILNSVINLGEATNMGKSYNHVKPEEAVSLRTEDEVASGSSIHGTSQRPEMVGPAPYGARGSTLQKFYIQPSYSSSIMAINKHFAHSRNHELQHSKIYPEQQTFQLMPVKQNTNSSGGMEKPW